MTRSVLLSVMIIGAVAAFIASAGTFAAFTGEGSDSGDITAGGPVTLIVEGTDTPGLVFSTAGANPCTAITPETSCSDTVTVTNNSGYPVELGIAAGSAVGTLDTCDGGPPNLSYLAGAYGDSTLDQGEATSFLFTVTLADVGNPCQGQTATVTVTVPASSLPLP